MDFAKEDPILHRKNYRPIYKEFLKKCLGKLGHLWDWLWGRKDDQLADFIVNLGYKEWFYYNGEIFLENRKYPISFAIAFVASNLATTVVGWIYVPNYDKDSIAGGEFYYLHEKKNEDEPGAAKVHDYDYKQITFDNGTATKLSVGELEFSSYPPKFSIKSPKFDVEGEYPKYNIHLKDKDEGVDLELELEDPRDSKTSASFCKEPKQEEQFNKRELIRKMEKKLSTSACLPGFEKKLQDDSFIGKVVDFGFIEDPVCKWYHSGQVKIKKAEGRIGDINVGEEFKNGYSFYEKVWAHVPSMGAYWRWFDAHLKEKGASDYNYAFDVYLPKFLGIFDVKEMQECWFCVEDKPGKPVFTVFPAGSFEVDPDDDKITLGKHTLKGDNGKDTFEITFDIYDDHVDYPFNEPHAQLKYGMRMATVSGTFYDGENEKKLEGYGQIEFTPLDWWI